MRISPLLSLFAGLTLASSAVAACSSESTTASPAAPTPTTNGADAAAPDARTAPSNDAAAAPDVERPNVDPGDNGKTVPDDLAARALGSFAMRTRVATTSELPILGKSSQTSVGYGLVTIARDGQGLKIEEKGCHVDIESSNSSVTTTVPDAIAQSIPVVASPFRLWKDGADVKFARPEMAIAIGVRLADPMKDALPTASTDARVFDQDGDGKPGVTVKVAGLASGDIYVVQRQRSAYAGTLGPGDVMAGLVVDTSDQAVVGASNPLLNQSVNAAPDPDSSKSTVRFAKLPSGYDCAQIIANKAQLFPQ